MLKIEEKVQIYKPLPEVFAFVTNVRAASRWSGMLEEVVVTSEGPLKVGSKGFNRMRLLWKTAKVGWEITGLEPNRTFVVTSTSGPIYGLYFYRFQWLDNTTLINLRVEAEPRGAFKILEPVFGQVVLSQIAWDLVTLKQILENKTSSPG